MIYTRTSFNGGSMKLSNKVVIRAVALRRQAKLIQFIADKPASMNEIIHHLGLDRKRVNHDLVRLRKIGAIKVTHSAKCPIANRLCGFYQSTGVNFDAETYLSEATALGVNELLMQAQKAKTEKQEKRDAKRATVLKVANNPHATVYLNSNKPSGWYNWQRSKKDNVVRAPGCSFAII